VWLGYDALKKGLCDELKTSDDVLLDMAKSDAIVLQLSYQSAPKGFFARLRAGEDTDGDLLGMSDEHLLSLAARFVRELSGISSRGAASPPPFAPSLSYEDPFMIAGEEGRDGV
jgi:ClpP class serine protease